MMFTARQLEQMHREMGAIVLPYRARLTPLAVDWVRAKKVVVGYSDSQSTVAGARPHPSPLPGGEGAKAGEGAISAIRSLLWWCDGPCGAGKAAISQVEREIGISAVPVPQNVAHTAVAVKFVAEKIKGNRASGAVFILENGAAAMLFANRCSSIRAILGTTLSGVDKAMNDVAPNLLALEHGSQTLMQMKNIVLRFARNRREPSDFVVQGLKEMATCA